MNYNYDPQIEDFEEQQEQQGAAPQSLQSGIYLPEGEFLSTRTNSKELADLLFDSFFQVDLTSAFFILKDTVWAIGWFALGDSFSSVQSWLGKLFRSRVVDAKAEQLMRASPLASLGIKYFREPAEQWYNENEKTNRATKEGRKTVHYLRVRTFDGTNPSPSLKRLSEMMKKDLSDFIFSERSIPDLIKNHKVSRSLDAKNKKKKKEDFIGPLIPKARRVESSEPHAASEYAQIPFVQVFESPTYIKLVTHTPFLAEPLKIDIVANNAIKFSGVTSAPERSRNDEILFQSGWVQEGPFERVIALPGKNYETRGISKSGSGCDFTFVLKKVDVRNNNNNNNNN